MIAPEEEAWDDPIKRTILEFVIWGNTIGKLMMKQNDRTAGLWVPLLEYAVRKNISLSTLRRYIKSNKIDYRSENGRYLIWDQSEDSHSPNKVDELSLELQKAQEEIAELKTLIAFYEEAHS